MANLELIELTKHYRQGKEVVRALDGISLKIGGGEFVSVVGRSGSGKTTFLDLVGLLLRPTSGSIRIDGVDTAGLRDGQLADLRGEKLGFIFQDYNLMQTLNAVENVMLPLRYNKAKRVGGKERALQLMEEVGLSDRINHRPSEMSGGQQQRVAVARAFINQPQLVLGDEPTGNLDSHLAQELIGIMRTMNRERGVTFVIVTHDMEIAQQTDRIIRLKDGKVISDEPVAAGSQVPALAG